jgi:hypothetical protein
MIEILNPGIVLVSVIESHSSALIDKYLGQFRITIHHLRASYDRIISIYLNLISKHIRKISASGAEMSERLLCSSVPFPHFPPTPNFLILSHTSIILYSLSSLLIFPRYQHFTRSILRTINDFFIGI